ncbi:MAG: TatD family hydrolase [Deltaproteobacteria bacterium]|nr:TatD family hydrolase [Deltaproteobacteria bacterium]
MTATAARYLDSHLHLQEKHLAPQIDIIMERARNAGVARMLCNATREKDWQAVVDLAAEAPEIIPFLGIHPWFAETAVTGWEERLLSLLQQVPAGIGETGLDKCCRADFGRQQQIFLTQLKMASELQRPLVIHCVKAWGRLLEMLEQFAAPLPPIMIHSFTGSRETLQRLLRLGCFISFSGWLATDGKLHLRFLETPLANLLLETDAPAQPNRQLPPGSHDQTVICDEPAAITQLYKLAATMRKMPLDEFRQEIWKNGEIFTDTIIPR